MLIAISFAGCGATQPARSGATADRGDAARIICEAECAHAHRCGNDDASCPERCPTLPVRQPAIWSASWAHEIARCFDHATCAHDSDEACVFATTRHTSAAAACEASPARDWKCAVLNGLTDDAAERAHACYARGDDHCVPRFDWK